MPKLEMTFGLIKPHVLKNICVLNRVEEIIKDNFIIVKCKKIVIDPEIASKFYEAHYNGAIIHKRPQHLARDDTSSIDAVQDFIASNKHYNKIALFQCTSVFLKHIYVLQAFKLFQTHECVFSATRSFKLRWKINENGFPIPINFDPKLRLRRQDWKGELIENGMFYFADRKLLEQGLFQSSRCGVVEISSKDSLEIDTIADLKITECLLKNDTDLNLIT